MDDTKTCTGCKLSLPISDFPPKGGGRPGRKARCRPCLKMYAKEWRDRNPDKTRATSRRGREKRGDEIRQKAKEWRVNNAELHRQRSNEWYHANKDKVAAQLRYRKYGMTVEDYEQRLSDQGGGCAVCGSTEPGKGVYFHVDHDHACCPGDASCGSCIRGLLCVHCNVGLGHLRDDPVLLESALAYLKRPLGV